MAIGVGWVINSLFFKISNKILKNLEGASVE